MKFASHPALPCHNLGPPAVCFQAVFHTVDILQDEPLRQALKQYSDWPTYPQLYVKGELVGGCDIVAEMTVGGMAC